MTTNWLLELICQILAVLVLSSGTVAIILIIITMVNDLKKRK